MRLTSEAQATLAREGFSRREFLNRSGLLIVSFSAMGFPSPASGTQTGTAAGIDAGQLDSWLAVAADGTVTGYTGKCELGQGMHTVQIQLIAEELSVPIERVRLVACDTAITPDQGTTSGSQSTPTNFNSRNLALAAATARQALIQRASRRLALAPDQLTAIDGTITSRTDSSKTVSYGDLLAGERFSISLDVNAKRKPHREWTVLGRSIPRVDMAAMVTGQFEYVHNVRVDGMLHGRVVRPPAIGANLLNVDEQSVAGLPGFVKIVVKHNFVGVVCEKPWQAIRAAQALKATWSPGTKLPAQATFYEHMRRQPSR